MGNHPSEKKFQENYSNRRRSESSMAHEEEKEEDFLQHVYFVTFRLQTRLPQAVNCKIIL